MRNFKGKTEKERTEEYEKESLSKLCPICSTVLYERYEVKPKTWRCPQCGYTRLKEIQMISREEVLMGRDKDYPLTPELEKNLTKLLEALNKFRKIYGKPLIVSSGYRPGEYNKKAGGAKNSAHLTCEAVDFHDSDDKIKEFVVKNPKILEDCSLFMEDPSKTDNWIHLQIRIVTSGKRIFKP